MKLERIERYHDEETSPIYLDVLGKTRKELAVRMDEDGITTMAQLVRALLYRYQQGKIKLTRKDLKNAHLAWDKVERGKELRKERIMREKQETE